MAVTDLSRRLTNVAAASSFSSNDYAAMIGLAAELNG